MTDVDWPCDRRDAHGPHRVEWTDTVPEHDPACDGNPERCSSTCPIPVPVLIVDDCPGVKAHPATMIGRGEFRPATPERNNP